MRDELLADPVAAGLRTIVVWQPLSGAIHPPSAEERVFGNDPRVTHLWDDGVEAGFWYGDRSRFGKLFGIAGKNSFLWDAYVLYGPDARIDDLDDVLAAGKPLYYERSAITDALRRLASG